MLLWTIQTTLISVIIIFLVHQIIEFLKATLTVPKIKDLVHSPLQKYENMIQTMSSCDSKEPEHVVITPLDSDTMKNELKNFLKDHLKKDILVENSTDISSLQTID